VSERANRRCDMRGRYSSRSVGAQVGAPPSARAWAGGLECAHGVDWDREQLVQRGRIFRLHICFSSGLAAGGGKHM
jgi:hypothetical protein